MRRTFACVLASVCLAAACAESKDAAPLADFTSIADWNAKMKMVDEQIKRSGGYVANARFSLADIVVALSTHRWMMTPFDKPELPAVVTHYARAKSRGPGVAYLGAETP